MFRACKERNNLPPLSECFPGIVDSPNATSGQFLDSPVCPRTQFRADPAERILMNPVDLSSVLRRRKADPCRALLGDTPMFVKMERERNARAFFMARNPSPYLPKNPQRLLIDTPTTATHEKSEYLSRLETIKNESLLEEDLDETPATEPRALPNPKVDEDDMSNVHCLTFGCTPGKNISAIQLSSVGPKSSKRAHLLKPSSALRAPPSLGCSPIQGVPTAECSPIFGMAMSSRFLKLGRGMSPIMKSDRLKSSPWKRSIGASDLSEMRARTTLIRSGRKSSILRSTKKKKSTYQVVNSRTATRSAVRTLLRVRPNENRRKVQTLNTGKKRKLKALFTSTKSKQDPPFEKRKKPAIDWTVASRLW